MPEGQDSSPTMNYTIRKGDSISRIAMRELNVTFPELKKVIDDIKRLNPDIKNYDMIYPGHTLQLPRQKHSHYQKRSPGSGSRIITESR